MSATATPSASRDGERQLRARRDYREDVARRARLLALLRVSDRPEAIPRDQALALLLARHAIEARAVLPRLDAEQLGARLAARKRELDDAVAATAFEGW